MTAIKNSITTTYRGFLITPVFEYTSGTLIGKSDFEYHRIEDPEVGGRVFRGTIEKVHEEIDSLWESILNQKDFVNP